MSLSSYFQTATGTGVLSTANSEGKVNAAIYARPHFLEEGNDQRLSFIMRDRLSHRFLDSNPHAFFTFIEDGEGYVGKRLALKKIGEETDITRIQSIGRKDLPVICMETNGETVYLVHFSVEKELPLVGS